jgi:hypothetical protein
MKRTRFLLILDTLLLLSLLFLQEPRFAGLAVHEWLGLAVIPLLVIHILYAWPWIAPLAARLKAKGAWRLRVNVLLNLALFIAFVVASFSGVMISGIALPALGIPTTDKFEAWLLLHNQWTLYAQILAGAHLAMNWNWIVGAVRRHVLARPSAKGEDALAALAEKAEA